MAAYCAWALMRFFFLLFWGSLTLCWHQADMLDIDLIVQECSSGLRLSFPVLSNENSAVPISLTLLLRIYNETVTNCQFSVSLLCDQQRYCCGIHFKFNCLHLENWCKIKCWHKRCNLKKWIVEGNRIRLDSNLHWWSNESTFNKIFCVIFSVYSTVLKFYGWLTMSGCGERKLSFDCLAKLTLDFWQHSLE